jgi:peptidoglycan L-alanyl-D-glutamate endopeptidase CwlK
MWKLGSKSRERLKGVHPDLVLVVSRALLYPTVDFTVNEGVRTPARQTELVRAGASLTLYSKHLVQEDGFGHAVDLVATGDLDKDGDIDAQDRALTWDPALYRPIAFAMMQAARELAIAIRWGGEFKKRNGEPFFDGPHFELVA